jgi:delta 1-pyrroline-5-carboxylate dehydrogenase
VFTVLTADGVEIDGFGAEQTVSVNTTAAGGNAALLASVY